MTQSLSKTFRTVLEQIGVKPRIVIARIPIDLKKAWPEWRNRRVNGEINGFAFRTTLFPIRGEKGLAFLVTKAMRTGARVDAGDKAEIRLEPHLGEYAVEVPKELARILKSERELRKWFEGLPPGTRNYLSAFISQAKMAETREARAEKVAESLMLTLEGEQFPPPILRAAFREQPLAEMGWTAMTPTQRRNHLIGIFFVHTVNGRERRVAMAVEDCVRVAQKKRGVTRSSPFEEF
jgi:uncharacterized protein YdeI (YjbR/CyaY-like superfamily)